MLTQGNQPALFFRNALYKGQIQGKFLKNKGQIQGKIKFIAEMHFNWDSDIYTSSHDHLETKPIKIGLEDIYVCPCLEGWVMSHVTVNPLD